MSRIVKSREFLVLLLLVVMVFAVSTVNKAVLRPTTLINIANSSLFLMLIALGQMFVVLTRGIDVSVGAIAGLSAVIFGFALNAGIPLPVAMLAALLTGLLCGMFNGVGVVLIGIPPIIMTLGTLGLFRGLMRILTGGSWIESIPRNIKDLAVTRILNVPMMVWGVAALIIIVWVLMNKIRWTRNLYAVGDNLDGAFLLGINTSLTRFVAFSLAGLFSGAAAIVFVGQIGFVPLQTGDGQELKAIAAVVLGGVSLMGGTGGVWSAVIGALFLTSVDSMMIFLRIPGSWNNAVGGAVLLMVVVVDYLIRRAAKNRSLALRSAEMLKRDVAMVKTTEGRS